MTLGEREKRILYLVAANGDGGSRTIEGERKQKWPWGVVKAINRVLKGEE